MSDKKYTIIAFVDGPAFNDVVCNFGNAGWIKRRIPGSVLVACFNPRVELSAEALLLCPDIDYIMAAESGVSIDDLMDSHYSPMEYMPKEIRDVIAEPDLVLTPSMLRNLYPLAEGAVLEIPAWYGIEAKERLIAMGLDPGRWFACIHVREDGYRGGRSPRSVHDVDPYNRLIDHIIEEQGGQVIRLGDQSMTPIPPRHGLVDLSRLGAPLLQQCFSVAHARYMIGSDSGPCSWAFLFDTPLGQTNKLNPVLICPHIFVCSTKTFIMEDDSRLSGRAAGRAGLMNEWLWYGKMDRVVENSVDDLVKVADYLFEKTVDRAPWTLSPQVKRSEGDPCELYLHRIPQPYLDTTYLEDL